MNQMNSYSVSISRHNLLMGASNSLSADFGRSQKRKRLHLLSLDRWLTPPENKISLIKTILQQNANITAAIIIINNIKKNASIT